ncbi:MAG: hypothetical protein ACN0LA_15530 [Candidatus Longimicrobiales bacterium M2_2A_002]
MWSRAWDLSIEGVVTLAVVAFVAVGGCAPDTEESGAGGPSDTVGDTAGPPGGAAVVDPTSVWERARRAGVDVRAVGQEPGWYVEITRGAGLLAVVDYGQDTLRLPAPEPEEGPGGERVYRVVTAEHELAVVLEERECRDAMNGMLHPLTVTLRLDGRELRGCGRRL